jgi:hypothetical protein
MNMAIALAASRWNEFAAEPDAGARMSAWLDEVERRAVVRGATREPRRSGSPRLVHRLPRRSERARK